MMQEAPEETKLLPLLHSAIHEAQRTKPGSCALRCYLVRRGGRTIITVPFGNYEGCPLGRRYSYGHADIWGRRDGDVIVAEAWASPCIGGDHDVHVVRAKCITSEEEALLGEWGDEVAADPIIHSVAHLARSKWGRRHYV